ncbi:MAG: winged helix-turn-helix domain-containing protein [Dehalococcoidia bacterium]|nr:winged helix-turn-helix domain-containing protein [Dehalococcoidia bacterium]
MQLAVYDPVDDLFAYLLTTSARRRGHVARQVTGIGEIHTVFSTPPSAIIVGVSELDDRAIENVEHLRSSHGDSLIYIAAEQARSRPVVSALESGATEVIKKPVVPSEIIMRAEIAAASRGVSPTADSAIRVSDIVVDINQALATKAGITLALTRMELRLLYCLAEHRGRVAPTDRLLAFASKSEEFSSSGLKTHISHLRQKLSAAGGQPVTIKSRQMLGYILEVADPK